MELVATGGLRWRLGEPGVVEQAFQQLAIDVPRAGEAAVAVEPAQFQPDQFQRLVAGVVEQQVEVQLPVVAGALDQRLRH